MSKTTNPGDPSLFVFFLRTVLPGEAGYQGIHRGVGSPKVIVFPEVGNHLLPYDPSRVSVIDLGFQTVPGSDKGFTTAVPHLRLDKDYRPVVFTCLPYLPLFAEAESKVRSGVSRQIAHGDHVQLGGGGVVVGQ